jgi:hypothetical protein
MSTEFVDYKVVALRHRKFFSIEELNQAIHELRERINQRPVCAGVTGVRDKAIERPVFDVAFHYGHRQHRTACSSIAVHAISVNSRFKTALSAINSEYFEYSEMPNRAQVKASFQVRHANARNAGIVPI